jgi:OOP family OmpA-OmpF porin
MRNPVQRATASYVRGLKIAALASAACFAGTAGAAEQVLLPEQYLSFGLSYLTADDPVEYGIGIDLGYARRFGTGRWLEGRAFMNVQETGSDTIPDFYQSGVGVDFIQSLANESNGHFFLLGGLGVAMNDRTPDSDDGSSFFANAGIGWRGAVTSTWGVRPRVELRYVHDEVADGSDAVVLGFKLEMPPKRQTQIEKVVEVEKIVEVPVEVEKIVEKEVTCVVPPAAPTGPVDADMDGVTDDMDKCPGTLKGAKVDGQGCVVEEQKISLPNIEFESGKTVLAPGGKDKLEAVVEFLNNQGEVQVDVFGHTDAQGKDSYNQALSEGRAKSVMEYLVSRGVSASRLSSKGFGETQPIATNETVEGRAQNRRVELLIRTKK